MKRKFGGKSYNYYGACTGKREAQSIAKEIRRGVGRLARVTPDSDGMWVVWERGKR